MPKPPVWEASEPHTALLPGGHPSTVTVWPHRVGLLEVRDGPPRATGALLFFYYALICLSMIFDIFILITFYYLIKVLSDINTLIESFN